MRDDFPPKKFQQNGADTDRRQDELFERLASSSLQEWNKQRRWKKNIREGQSYFNGPSDVTHPRKHSPSQLLKCKRKSFYKRLNAPEETDDPMGIFWIGSRLEEDLVMPFLEETVAETDQYVTNSIWIDFIVQTDVGKVRLKGATDPVIVTEDAEPILPFEIKTKRSVDDLRSPNGHHRAQVHAYLKGLSKKYDSTIDEAVLLYVSRADLDIQPFRVKFNQDFWKQTILPWITDVTAHQLKKELPPAEPEYDWECHYCPYKERCGEGDREYENEPPTGLLPLFDYPRCNLAGYLEVHGEKLTPHVAHQYPELADQFGVYDWTCSGCDVAFDWKELSPRQDSPPRCPRCSEEGTIRFVSGPKPKNQHPFVGDLHD